jgi:hypothetical protein
MVQTQLVRVVERVLSPVGAREEMRRELADGETVELDAFDGPGSGGEGEPHDCSPG